MKLSKKQHKNKITTALLAFITGVIFLTPHTSNAQSSSQLNSELLSLGIAIYLPVIGETIPDGSIISTSSEGFTLSTSPYDPKIIGVVSSNPAISLESNNDDTSGKYPVVSTGSALVRVSETNGQIHKGDLITASPDAGVGMKATLSGFVLGSAVEDFTPLQNGDTGLIPITINIHYYSAQPSLGTNISDILNLSAAAIYEEPLIVLKYIIAGIIMILSIIFGFLYFGRVASAGIEALGRNPLASKTIQMGILTNVVITIAIVAAGVIISVLIIRLDVQDLAIKLF
ncbi:ATP synthase F0 subunit C [candidate division WWE3 bacterium]|nr:ATP synthase F0 subunit C [candidate division WWE3 bacterium]